MAEPVAKLLVLEEQTLMSLAAKAPVVQEFPFLGVLNTVRTGCSSCGAAASRRANAVRNVKFSIAGMSTERKRRLKEVLNTEQARVIYNKPDGAVVSLTF